MTTRERLISSLTSRSAAGFLKSDWRLEATVDPVSLCIEAALALESAELTASEKGRRLSLFLPKLQLDRSQLRQVAERWQIKTASLKNALGIALPPEFRPLLFGRSAVLAPPALNESVPPVRAASQIVDPSWKGTFAGILLLATDDQSANKDLLRREKLAPIPLRSVQEFDAHIETDHDICGCVVDGSFTKYLSREEQVQLFARIAELSSFISVRVQDSGLLFSYQELSNIFRTRQANPKAPDTWQLTLRDDGHLKAAEIEQFRSAQRLLQTHSQGVFVPGELDENELCTLMAAVQKYSSGKTLDGIFTLSSLKTKFIPGGRTSARIASLQINKGGLPLVAKIDERAFILDEGRRFFTFISQSDTRLQPTVHIHGKAGVIIFGLIDEQTSNLIPAPTLESLLQELWWLETYDHNSDHNSLENDLKAGIKNAAQKLALLGGKPAVSSNFADVAAPYMPPLKQAESLGRTWGPSGVLIEQRAKAEELFARFAGKATVHGDVHLRNILVRGYKEAYVIDYARSGPGHPATDLVRLELSLFVNAFRPFWRESDSLSFQKMINDPMVTDEKLFNAFPEVAKWMVNRVCISGMTAARDCGLELIRQYGGSVHDYLAAKMLFAWQGLLFKDLQVSLCRAAIEAICF